MLPPVPEDILPDYWKNDVRMNVLFAPVRSRSVNPKDWDAKYNFWRSLIRNYCTRCGIIQFKISDLKRIFTNRGQSPCCLEMVVEEMLKSGEFVDSRVFLDSDSDGWVKWAIDRLVKMPLIRGYVLSGPKKSSDETRYVHLETVKSEASKFLSLMPNTVKGNVVSLQELMEMSSHDFENLEDVEILIALLAKEGKACFTKVRQNLGTDDRRKNILVKLDDKSVKPITNVEIGIYTLGQSEKLLKENIEIIEGNIRKIKEEAKIHILKERREMAKSCLRKKQELEKCLLKRSNALYNVQILISRIENAETDSEVFASYNIALSSLKDTFRCTGLTEESVAETMLELSEVLEKQDDIEAALAHSIREDDDVQEELEQLLIEDQPSELPSKERLPSTGEKALLDLGSQLETLHIPSESRSKSPKMTRLVPQ